MITERFEMTEEYKETLRLKEENDIKQRELRSEIFKKTWESGKIELNIRSINESKKEIEFREILKTKTNLHVCKKAIKINKKLCYHSVYFYHKPKRS
jgi:hypothetical protein